MEIPRWIESFRRQLRALVYSRRVDDELRDELSFHFEMAMRSNLERGMTEIEAGRRVGHALNDVEQTAERCRDVRRLRWLNDLASDLRYTQRALRRAPAFTLDDLSRVADGVARELPNVNAGAVDEDDLKRELGRA
jgi:hypothetical protein